MKKQNPINRNLIRDQVYEYLREHIVNRKFLPGFFVDRLEIQKELGISQTPLREAFLQLQADGFVTIEPQRGVMIKRLTLKDVYNICEIIGGLESQVIMSVFDRIGTIEIEKMKKINNDMNYAKQIYKYYELNHQFHNVFLDLSENDELLHHIKIYKLRLFDFFGVNFGEKYRENNFKEHLEFLKNLESDDRIGSADYLRDVHWAFMIPESLKEHYASLENTN